MGLGRNTDIYTKKWINGLKGIPPTTFTATIDFWDKSTEVVAYDRQTNRYTVDYVSSVAQPLKCRVQPMRSAVQRFTAVDGTWTGHLLISMSYDDRFDVQAGSRAKVVSVTHNNSLLTKFLTVKEILDSDNSIEFTLLCEVDTELSEQG